jgi:hypothetical protein
VYNGGVEDIVGTILGKIVLALAVALGIGIAMARQRARNAKLAPAIESRLREGGPQTLPELASALGMGGFLARGKVVLALGDLVNAGRVEVIDAPPGTAQLEKVNHIRYRWRDGQ